MSGHRPTPGGRRRRTADELDALLDAGSSGDRRLDRVLSAARGPARPHELSASAPTLGATPAATPAAMPSRSRRVLTRLGTATVVTKVTTGAIGAVVVGAAAVAGATHHLPGQTRHPAPRVAPSTSSESGNTRSTKPSPSRSTSSPSGGTLSPATTVPGSSPASSDATAIPALCRVWLTLPPGADTVRSQPRFLVLIRIAGSAAAVDGYCRSLPIPSVSGGPLPSISGSSSADGSTSTGRSPLPGASRSVTPRRSPSGSLTR